MNFMKKVSTFFAKYKICISVVQKQKMRNSFRKLCISLMKHISVGICEKRHKHSLIIMFYEMLPLKDKWRKCEKRVWKLAHKTFSLENVPSIYHVVASVCRAASNTKRHTVILNNHANFTVVALLLNIE